MDCHFSHWQLPRLIVAVQYVLCSRHHYWVIATAFPDVNSIKDRQIFNPMPVPLGLVELKGINRLSCWLVDKPAPLS